MECEDIFNFVVIISGVHCKHFVQECGYGLIVSLQFLIFYIQLSKVCSYIYFKKSKTLLKSALLVRHWVMWQLVSPRFRIGHTLMLGMGLCGHRSFVGCIARDYSTLTLSHFCILCASPFILHGTAHSFLSQHVSFDHTSHRLYCLIEYGPKSHQPVYRIHVPPALRICQNRSHYSDQIQFPTLFRPTNF